MTEKERFQKFMTDAEQGKTWSMIEVGVCYLNGAGVEKNISSALNWWRKAAMTDDERWAKDACRCLTNYYLDTDTDLALQWAERMYELGDRTGLITVADSLCDRGYLDKPKGTQRDLGFHKGLEVFKSLYEREETKGGELTEIALLFYMGYANIMNRLDCPSEQMTDFLKSIEHLLPDCWKAGGSAKDKGKKANLKSWLKFRFRLIRRNIFITIAVLHTVILLTLIVANIIVDRMREKSSYVVVCTAKDVGYWTRSYENSHIVKNSDGTHATLDNLEDGKYYIYNSCSWPRRAYIYIKDGKGMMHRKRVVIPPHKYFRADSISFWRYKHRG